MLGPSKYVESAVLLLFVDLLFSSRWYFLCFGTYVTYLEAVVLGSTVQVLKRIQAYAEE